ncbi:hypothetical protein DM01DRAFT_1331449 [Hesseltinella vesiculosa]|uniref:Uncharacterized protein n=1 Tax=Hesseltinella vesiculosa TaxID=101127 RepID=A0A1X2GVC5_9FUNG|nr:hypothetical protein DM01DRAFT_1331449 [Hesseltinella vesiculosa]
MPMIPLYYKLLILFLCLQVLAQQPQDQSNAKDLTTPTPETDVSMDYYFEDELDDGSAENDDEEEQHEQDDIDQSTTFDIDNEPMDYYGLMHDNVAHQDEGDELGEELVTELDDDDDEDQLGDGDYLYEDDESLEFKNDEDIDLNQLLFEASQKSEPLEWPEDPAYQKDDHDHDHDHAHPEPGSHIHDPTDPSLSHDDVDLLLSNADDALHVDGDDGLDDGHPDHVLEDSLSMAPIPVADLSSSSPPLDPSTPSSHRKLPLFGIFVLLLLLYKVSNKRFQRREKNDSYLPLHTQGLDVANNEKPSLRVDLHTPEHSYPNNSVTSSISPTKTTSSPLPSQGHPSHARRSSNLSGIHAKGHARRISASHSIAKETKYNQ